MSSLFIQFVSIMTAIGSIAIKTIGYPDQIRRIIKTKQTNNISLLNYWLTLITYIFWTIHGCILHDWVVIMAQALGIVTSGVLLLVTLYVKRKQGLSSENSIIDI